MKRSANQLNTITKKTKKYELKSYILWNNKASVGKSTLIFNLASLYALNKPDEDVIIIDLCPQSSISSIILGGRVFGDMNLVEQNLKNENINPLDGRSIFTYFLHILNNLDTSSKQDNKQFEDFLTHINPINNEVPSNIKLLMGSQNLSIIENQLASYSTRGNAHKNEKECWIQIHTCLKKSLEQYLKTSNRNVCVFIDTNHNFSISTTIGIVTADFLIIPIVSDYMSRSAMSYLISLIYGPGSLEISFASKASKYNIKLPKIHTIISNKSSFYDRIPERNPSSISNIVMQFLEEIYMNQNTKNIFINRDIKNEKFKDQYLRNISDFNILNIASSHAGIPIYNIKEKFMFNPKNNKESYTINHLDIVKQLVKIISRL